MGVPLNHPFLDGIFPLRNQPAIGVPPWLWKAPQSFGCFPRFVDGLMLLTNCPREISFMIAQPLGPKISPKKRRPVLWNGDAWRSQSKWASAQLTTKLPPDPWYSEYSQVFFPTYTHHAHSFVCCLMVNFCRGPNMQGNPNCWYYMLPHRRSHTPRLPLREERWFIRFHLPRKSWDRPLVGFLACLGSPWDWWDLHGAYISMVIYGVNTPDSFFVISNYVDNLYLMV